ncbi:MAG: hypothetical protein Q4F02_02585 [Candidatus Saccharibacteria bacterium]|nr:hypothetical protein [Candidatus Saccharibacteria bacterium]
MAIVFRKGNQTAQVLNEVAFAQEDTMQKYLLDNPEIVPIYDIDDDARLLVAAREFSTMSGPIDALGFDASGNIYVIETKLFKNPDKRTVLAQAMDYGAALWKHHADARAFFDQLNDHTQKQFEQTFAEKLTDFFQLEDVDDVLKNITTNLEDGSIKFVVLMDKLEGRLKDLIAYINQNSKFDVYAVEIDFYRHDEFEIVIPKLYGAEVRKEVATKTSSGQQRRKWDDAAFRAKVAELPEVQRRAVLAIYEWSREKADKIVFGTGVKYASVNPRFLRFNRNSFFTLFSDGRLSINFGYVDSDEGRMALMNFLDDHFGFTRFGYDADQLASQYPTIGSDAVMEHYQRIIEVFEQFITNYEKEEVS